MKHLLYVATIIPHACGKTSAQLCAGTATQASDGNWYCSEVQAITYNNISQAGAYNRTTTVDPSTGLCGHETLRYSAASSLTPLFGEVSMHLRGPMNISQLAVYQVPAEATKLRKRNRVPFSNRRRAPQHEDRFHDASFSDLVDVRRWATATDSNSASTIASTGTLTDCGTEQGKYSTATFKPNYDGHLLPRLRRRTTAESGRYAGTNSTIYQQPPTVTSKLERHPVSCLEATSAQSRDLSHDRANIDKRAAEWDRIAHYTSATPAQATGLSFLANLGDPSQSGTFDYAFGNSLSYVVPAGNKVAPDSQPFNGTLDTSEYEIAVFSDKQCDQGCSYWRPNATSHYAWSGSSKAFFIEFQMDHYPNRGSDYGEISDAPAWWFLNADIPRILQYGNDRNNIPCSCWSTGCGEFDAFEVLGAGEERAKSTLHRQGSLEGGDSNYFGRPVGNTMKFAVVWHFPDITALVLNSSFEFPESLSEDQIDALVAYDPNSWVHSLFPIGS